MLIILQGIVYDAFGHSLVREMYAGSGPGLLANLITQRDLNPLEYYLNRADKIFLIANFLFIVIAIDIWIAGHLLIGHKTTLSEKYQALMSNAFPADRKTQIQQWFAGNKRIILLFLALWVGFFVLYAAYGVKLSETSAFSEFDVLFEADTPWMLNNIAVFDGVHKRTKVHPLYIIMMNPYGSIFNALTGSKVTGAVLANSLFAALGTAMGFLFLWLYSHNLVNSLLISGFFGLSMSQLFFGVVPGPGSMAVSSLLFTYILFSWSLKEKQLCFSLWIIAGILSFGVTITNFAQTLACFMVLNLALYSQNRRLDSMFVSIFAYGNIVAISAVLLAILQKIIYPTTRVFFNPLWYGSEIKAYSSLLILSEPLTVIPQLVKNFFFSNIIGTVPTYYEMAERSIPAATFSVTWDYSTVGLVATLLWAALLVIGVSRLLFVDREDIVLFFGLLLCLLINLALHSVYGVGEKGLIELFIYSSNFSFLVVLLISPIAKSTQVWSKLVLLSLLLLTGYNNLIIVNELINTYA